MPVVHVQRYGGRKVLPEALPGVRRVAAETAESEGAGLAQAQGQTAQALGQLGAAGAQIATREVAAMAAQERDRADEVAVQEYRTGLGTWENSRLYDPEHGAFTVKGKDAMPLPEQLAAEFQQVSGALEANLSTDRQRAAAQRIKAQFGVNLDATTRRYVYGEVQRYDAETLEATVANATSSAVANALDPRRVDEELTRATDAITKAGPRLGWSAEVVAKKVQDVQSGTHVGVINRLLVNEQTSQAKIYYEEAKDQITGPAQTEVEKALHVGATRAEGQKQSDAILAAGGTPAEQRAKARQITDPAVRDDTMQRLEHEHAVQERDQREREEAVLLGAYNTVERSHDVTAIPAATWANLPGPQRESLRNYAHKLAKGEPVETDQYVYYMLKESATTAPSAFLATNLLTFKDKLSDADFQELTGLRGAIRNGNTVAANKVLDDYRSESAVIANTLTLAGLDATPADGDLEAKKRIAQFQGLVAAEARRVQADTGKKVTNEDLAAISNRILAMTITEKGWFWDSTKSLVEATPADVPEREMTLILDSLRQHGQPATPEAALGIWLKAQARKGPK